MIRERLQTFLFDAFEGLDEIEAWIVEEKEESWMLQAQRADKREGWLGRGLYAQSRWSANVFAWLAKKSREENEQTRCLVLGKVSELLRVLPYAEWIGDYLEKECAELKELSDDHGKSELFGEMCQTLSALGVRKKTKRCFSLLLTSLKELKQDEERARCCVSFAEGLSHFGGEEEWVGELFEELLEEIERLHSKEKVIETSVLVHEKFFGYEHLKPSMRQDSKIAIESLSCLLLMQTNDPRWRSAYAKRLFFANKEAVGKQMIRPQLWEEGLKAFDRLEDWFHQENSLKGEILWSRSGKMALLVFLQRDFSGYTDASWIDGYFDELLLRVGELKNREERKELLRMITINIWKEQKENERMLSRLFVEAEECVKDVSCIYEGLAWCNLEVGALQKAEEHTKMVKDKTAQDSLWEGILERYLSWSRTEKAVSLLHSFHGIEKRKKAALLCAKSPAIGSDPLACTMLCEEALLQMDDAEELYEALLKNPELEKEAKKALSKESMKEKKEDERMDGNARRERLRELELLQEDLPKEIYRKRRKALIYSNSPEKKAEIDGVTEEKTEMKETAKMDIMVDKPHRYGEKHYQLPKEHVEKNHFSKEVGGSLFTLWSSFDQMWEDIKEEIGDVLKKSEKKNLYVIEKEFPLKIGFSRVIELKKVRKELFAVEIRNGQACLVCENSELQEPTNWITIVIGTSRILPNEIDGYIGHEADYALYSVYPGRSSPPFPQCKTEEEKERLWKILKDVVNTLEKGRWEDAQKMLYRAYADLEENNNWARYWSEHVLIR